MLIAVMCPATHTNLLVSRPSREQEERVTMFLYTMGSWKMYLATLSGHMVLSGKVFEEAESNRRYFELVTHTKLNLSLVSL